MFSILSHLLPAEPERVLLEERRDRTRPSSLGRILIGRNVEIFTFQERESIRKKMFSSLRDTHFLKMRNLFILYRIGDCRGGWVFIWTPPSPGSSQFGIPQKKMKGGEDPPDGQP
jgi:hypothetical protein